MEDRLTSVESTQKDFTPSSSINGSEVRARRMVTTYVRVRIELDNCMYCEYMYVNRELDSLAGHTNFSRVEVGGVMGGGKNLYGDYS